MMYIDDSFCIDTMREILSANGSLFTYVGDKELMEDHAIILFNHLKVKELEPAMLGLVNELFLYRQSQHANDISSFFRENFLESPAKNYSRKEKVEELEKKVQEIITLMGGDFGTMKGNILKEKLRDTLENAEDYILQTKLNVTNSTLQIKSYLRKNGTSEEDIKDFTSKL